MTHSDLATTLEELEQSLLDPAVRRDRERLDQLLVDGFQEFAASGSVCDRATDIDALAVESREFSWSMTDFQIDPLGKGCVLATYRLTTFQPDSIRRTLRSSIWVLDGDRWKVRFHQATLVGRTVNLRPAGPGDRPFVERLHGAAYHDVVVEQFGGWDEQRQQGFFDEKWRTEQFEIVLADGDPVGAISVSIEPDHVHLNEMLVLPEHQGQGIGTSLLERVEANARERRLPVRLRVLHLNRARHLYERHGFEVTGRTETHLLMRADTSRPR